LLWLSEVIPASLTGIPPQSAQDAGTPTNVLHVLDMAWLLPALVVAAASLWRRRPLGYALAPSLLSSLVFLPLTILSMMLFQARGVEPVAVPKVMISIAFFFVSIGMLIWLLKNLKS
jgi:MYXO-CTERM domain-containing protein